MTRRFGWLWTALALMLGVAYQFLVHSAVAGKQSDAMRIALAFVPLIALAWWTVMHARNKLMWCFVLIAAGVAIYGLGHQPHWGLAAAYGLPHAIIYVSLLWLFGSSLRHGEEPLVARLARHVHGALAPELAAYTRRVTCAWCVFFSAQVVASVLLFQLAPLDVWSLFINFLNFPLLALMFAGEYMYRTLRHRDFPHASPLAGIRAFSRDAAHSTGSGT